MNDNLTRSDKVAGDVVALLKARNTLLWVVTKEEGRVERYLIEAALAAQYVPRTWDVAAGVCDVAGTVDASIGGKDPESVLAAIAERANNASLGERGVWILRDLPVWLNGPAFATTLRQLRNLTRTLPGIENKNQWQAVIVISPSGEVPAELAGVATVIDWPLPDRDEIEAILDSAIEGMPASLQAGAALNGTREQAVDAAVGLTSDEAAACYARSLVQHRKIDVGTVSGEKKRIIARERVLEWYDPLPGGLSAVGGLENLKQWLEARRLAYSEKARAYGLPAPKGALLVGVPGTGKSLTAKAVATAWNVPLLKVDLGALKSKFVGESEANLRKAFRVIEAIGRCVVWIDEIEKALAGATQGAADGGVSSDVLGFILNWMQERSGEAFVVATANDAASLPPELLRKGRFDEVWWIDLPNAGERRDIFAASLRTYGRGKLKVDLDELSAVSNGFTGAEIAALIPEAMFAAFADGEREPTTDDLVTAAGNVVPLSKTASEKLARLREWAAGRARPATKQVADKPARYKAGRQLDIS